MKHLALAFAALAGLAACDGNPIGQPPVDTGGGAGDVSVSELPGTTNPSAKTPITRTEAKNEGPGGATVVGNGYAEGISYNPTKDTFTVDNLAFDGANVYHRDKTVPSLGSANVYAAKSTYADDLTGAVIDQFSYRALYGVSKTGQTSFAIVRTGAYGPYGFGGFLYERNGSVTLPTSGQAKYTGEYSGLKDFDGRSGMYYVDGQMTVAIDFNDFNPAESATGNGAGVQGYVTDRHVFDMNGNDVTGQFVDQMNTDLALETKATALPTLVFTVGPGVLDNNGEMQGNVTSSVGGEQFEDGTYYAVMSGEGTNSEIAGIIVVTSSYDTAIQRDTGGFILYR